MSIESFNSNDFELTLKAISATENLYEANEYSAYIAYEKQNKILAVAEMGDGGHNRHGPKSGGGLRCPFRGEMEPRLIRCGLGQYLLLYQVASSSI